MGCIVLIGHCVEVVNFLRFLFFWGCQLKGLQRRRLQAPFSFDGQEFSDTLVTIEIDSNGIIADVQYGGPRCSDSVFYENATVLPGLVDTHVHLCWDPHAAAEDITERSVDELRWQVKHNCDVALACGVTTMRDLGDAGYAVTSVRDTDDVNLPRLLTAGIPLTPPRGHCWYLGAEVSDREAIARTIAEHAYHNVDLIKVMVSGGFLTPGSSPLKSQFSCEDLQWIIDCANKFDLRVVAHAHSSIDIDNAIEAGVHGVEHCSFVDQPPVDRITAILQKLSDKKIFMGYTVPNFDNEGAKSRMGHYSSILRIARDVGAPILFSSDCGTSPDKTFDRLPKDLQALETLGVNRSDILRGVTSQAAHACGVNTIGRIHQGSSADLLIVRGRLADSLAYLTDVVTVYRAGHEVTMHPNTICSP